MVSVREQLVNTERERDQLDVLLAAERERADTAEREVAILRLQLEDALSATLQ